MNEDQFWRRLPGCDWLVWEGPGEPTSNPSESLVEQAAKTYKIPVVRHDFPLPMHNWSFQAAVMAHYFDSRSKQFGSDFRDYIFQHQLEINPGNLRSFAEKFAADHKVDLPFVFDPQGKLAAEVSADRDLGNRIGIHHDRIVKCILAAFVGSYD